MSSHLRTTRPPFPTRLVLITCLLLMGLSQPSVAQIEDSSDNTAVSVVFSEVSETKIVGQSPELGIELSAVRENDNDIVSIQLSDNKTVVLSRNVGNFNFYVSSNQLDTATSFVAESGESTTIDVLAEYLWQYHGYSALGDTLLDALLVLSNWPQGVAFEEPELSTDEPDRVFYPLTVIISPDSTTGNVSSPTKFIDCGNGGKICKQNYVGTIGLIATPAAGYVFKQWSGACTGTITSCTVNMSLTGRAVTASFIRVYPLTVSSSNGKVTSNPVGINCGDGGNACNINFAAAENVTLTAIPPTSYKFTGWSGDCSGTATTCTVSMTAAKSVTANFSRFALSATINPNSGGTVNSINETGINCGNGNTACTMYPTLAQIALKATAAPSYMFAGWNQGCSGKNPNCLVSINGDTSVTANFVQNPISIEIKPGKASGNVTSSPSGLNCGNLGNVCSYVFNTTIGYSNSSNLYDPNAIMFYIADNDDQITLTAKPIEGYAFVEWGGACSGREPTCTVVPTGPKTAIANFTKANLLSVTVPTGSTAGNVTSYPSGINCGSSGNVCTQGFVGDVTLLAPDPAYGYVFAGWDGSCIEINEINRTCKVSMTAANTVKVKFIRGYYLTVDTWSDTGGSIVLRDVIQTVTVTNMSPAQQFTCTNKGVGTRSCKYPFPSGTTLSLTATPSGSYKFRGWEGNCSGSGSCRITMDSPKTVKATFAF